MVNSFSKVVIKWERVWRNSPARALPQACWTRSWGSEGVGSILHLLQTQLRVNRCVRGTKDPHPTPLLAKNSLCGHGAAKPHSWAHFSKTAVPSDTPLGNRSTFSPRCSKGLVGIICSNNKTIHIHFFKKNHQSNSAVKDSKRPGFHWAGSRWRNCSGTVICANAVICHVGKKMVFSFLFCLLKKIDRSQGRRHLPVSHCEGPPTSSCTLTGQSPDPAHTQAGRGLCPTGSSPPFCPALCSVVRPLSSG